MSECLPVRGSVLSSSSCRLKDAATFLRLFLDGDTLPDTGLLKGYLVSVSGSLQELISRRRTSKPQRSAKRKGPDHQVRRIQNYEKTYDGYDGNVEPGNPEVEPLWNGGKKESHPNEKEAEVDIIKDEHEAGKRKRKKEPVDGNAVPDNKNYAVDNVEHETRKKKRRKTQLGEGESVDRNCADIHKLQKSYQPNAETVNSEVVKKGSHGKRKSKRN